MLLSSAALKGIAAYEYHPGSLTWLDTKFTVYWDAIVARLPRTLAPNAITIFGTLLTITSSLALFARMPTMTEEAPTDVCIICALALFLYQTCDAIDGKQARRTGSSSSLGQLLDHGGDALCNVFSNLAVGVAIGTGASWSLMTLLSSTSIIFFLAQWEEYHTGTLRCGNGYVGVTEGLLLLVGLQLITAAFGHDVWNATATATLSVRDILILVVAIAMTFQAKDNIVMVLKAINSAQASSLVHNRSTKARALSQLVPTLCVLGTSIVWMLFNDVSGYAYTFFLAVGFSHVILSSRMIVSHMCKVPFGAQPDVILGLAGVIFCLLYSSAPAAWIATLYLLAVVSAHSLYTVFVVSDICDYLNISLLTIRDRQVIP
ncbi:CDP-alcohol phosphatidyltransferase [Achlya hypogyna]|uniref:CDP-alcohol phosphatidyltransferase n=1 Tax=Achlya hypogyna TaxID=1202772 RepID=A0A1V9Z6S2_ACHHY|nr:CDP-alcohol phosphatidyltransferase [Achlya hypogyna]